MVLAVLLSATDAAALSLEQYAATSRLASGQWVKISVPSTGMYCIPTAALREYGFSDVTKVRVYGYGGRRIDDELTADSYADDLPMVQSELTDKGLVFYGVGADTRVLNDSYYFHNENSIYTTVGYYFLGESADPAPGFETTGSAQAGDATDVVIDCVHHELDQVSPGESGALLVGEDFKYTPTRTFDFDLPSRSAGGRVWLECSFVAKTYNTSSSISFTANGAAVASTTSDRIGVTNSSSYYHGVETVTRHELKDISGERLQVGITHKASTTVYGAWLNYLTISYERKLQLPQAGYLTFTSYNAGLRLGGVTGGDLRVWDVTDPSAIERIDVGTASGTAVWTSSYGNVRRDYAAWTPSAAMPAPSFVKKIGNQNLHATGAADMVIITLAEWSSQAERVANLHRDEGLTVVVADAEAIYNEFASGCADVSALRKYLKMVYDRGAAEGKPLRYALLMGRATYDNCCLTAGQQALSILTLPSWLPRTSRAGLSDNDGYATDDFIAMLGDDTGSNLSLDDLTIAVGRIPCTSEADARSIVDKLYQYCNKSKRTSWKNRVLLLADDEDQGVHMEQTEAMWQAMVDTPGQQYLFNKVYMDAYEKSGGQYLGARTDMFDALDEGVVWWHYSGHASNHGWSHEQQLTFSDINSLYLSKVPFVLAATCDFLRWDSTTESGGEILYKERYGGTIGMISATRPVFISDNGMFVEAFGRQFLQRDAEGHLPTAGEAYRRAKNDIRDSRGNHVANSNRLRFVFMGDPAMRLATPDNIITLDEIDGEAVTLDNQVTLAARQHAVLSGSVTDAAGNVLSDFNGTILADLYDAETSVTTHGNGNGKQVIYDTQGSKLYTGAGVVKNGYYTLTVDMPSQVADNFRPATLSMYAYSDGDTAVEAVGVNRDFYVYGYDEDAVTDTTPPVIDTIVMNHESFTDGSTVNTTPMLIAHVSDDVALNLSTAGLGHIMTITLDDDIVLTDVLNFYTPESDGTPAGSINYQFDELTEGSHTARLRVFDTSGNATTATVTFFAQQGLAPKIYDVYTDANPATTEANFYLSHDQPDGIVTVTISVYNLMGKPVWTQSQTGMSDMFTSVPVTWDLTDEVGRRVRRGIYVYRATITTDNVSYETASRRLAVTGH